MKKTAITFTTIFTIISLVGVVGGTIYLLINAFTLASLLSALSTGGSADNVGFYVAITIMFLCVTIYFVFASATGLLTRRVLEADAYDKITKFGVLSIIFFNPVGGILAIVYNRNLIKQLEESAPKGKRKEIEKNEA